MELIDYRFCEIIPKINMPWAGNASSQFQFQLRFRFLRDLIALNDFMMLRFKRLLPRFIVSRFSNLDQLSEPVVNIFKNRRKKKLYLISIWILHNSNLCNYIIILKYPEANLYMRILSLVRIFNILPPGLIALEDVSPHNDNREWIFFFFLF